MGIIARGTAHVKNVTADPLASAGKFVARKTREAKQAVVQAEAEIEARKQVREQIRAQEENARKVMEDMAKNLVSKQNKGSKQNTADDENTTAVDA